MILVILFLLGACLASAQRTSSISTSTPASAQWTDPLANGRSNNPGARLGLSKKALDEIQVFAADQIAQMYKNLTVPNYEVTIGSYLLTIEPPRIDDVKLNHDDSEYSGSAKIRSSFVGKFSGDGAWSYRQLHGRNMGQWNGTYHAVVTDAVLNISTQLARNSDGRPWMQLTDCESTFQHFKVDIKGYPELTVVEDSTDSVSKKVRKLFEDSVCLVVRMFVKDVINFKLATFQNKILIHSDEHHKVELDYDLLNNEPKFVNGSLKAGLEGKTIWRGYNYVPFSPVDLKPVESDSMLTFELSDYVFNTMLQQAHSQGYRFSAAHMLNSTSIHDQLRLNCTKPSTEFNVILARKSKPAPKPTPKPKSANRLTESDSVSEWKCLGAVFENASTSIGQFSNDASGDLVFKTQKAPSVLILSEENAYFDASNSILEIYGSSKNNDQRKLLAKTDVAKLRAQFVPKFENGNFTGSVKILDFELKQGSIEPKLIVTRKTEADWMAKLEQFAEPMITNMINRFIKEHFQFPVPYLKGFGCASPKFRISTRTLQVECDDIQTAKLLID